MSRLSHPDVDYLPTREETTESTLAFILIDLESLDRSGVGFTIEQEDTLLEIERKCRELRNKLS